PPLSRDARQCPQRGARRCEDDGVRQLGRIAAAVAHQHPVVPAPLLGREWEPRQPYARPLVAARPCGTLSRPRDAARRPARETCAAMTSTRGWPPVCPVCPVSPVSPVSPSPVQRCHTLVDCLPA